MNKMIKKKPSKEGIYLYRPTKLENDFVEIVQICEDIEVKGNFWVHDYPENITSEPLNQIKGYWFGPIDIE